MAWVADSAAFLDGLASEDRFPGAVLIAKYGKVLLKEAYGLDGMLLASGGYDQTEYLMFTLHKTLTLVLH